MPTPTTREKLIAAGHEVFYREGFLMVGLDRLLNEVGCSKQTFYNHFASKDDLIVAVIDEHHRWWKQELRDRIRRVAGTDDARGQILAVLDVLDEIIHEPEYRGCIFINAAVEFPQPHHPAHQSAQRAKADSISLLADLAERAGASDPEALAQEIDMLIEGALITHQVNPDCDACAIARRAAETLMEKYLPAVV